MFCRPRESIGPDSLWKVLGSQVGVRSAVLQSAPGRQVVALNIEATSLPNREIPATLVRPFDQNTLGKIGETNPASYTQWKATQRSSKDQVA